MSYLASFPSSIQYTKAAGRGATSGESQRQRYASFSCFALLAYWSVSLIWSSPLTPSIHILDDDSLLNVFYLYRPFLLGEDGDENGRLTGGVEDWVRGRWWYKLSHVCQRWRRIILGSASHLGLSLVCTHGTPVANMLAHSPPLPLVIDYRLDQDGDEEGAILALKQYGRARWIRLVMPVTRLQKLIAAMDDEYPILEYLIIGHVVENRSSILMLPETLQAPHLCHLALFGFFALPIESRLLTTAVDLVTLYLIMVRPSTYFHPNTLLQWLSFMPLLENLIICFFLPIPNREVERQLAHAPIMTPVVLPNLHRFAFQGVRTYIEAVIYRITAPHLEKLQIHISNQLTFPVPRLLQFVSTTENFRFKSAKFVFADQEIAVEVPPHDEAETYALSINVNCCHLDWQVSSAAQISNSLSPMLSAVEHLGLGHREHNQSSEEHNEADPTEWRKLLRSFKNVKALRIGEGLVEELSHCLELDDGELSLELLPELQELTYFGWDDTGDAFTSFIHARQDAGRSITLIRRSLGPDPSSSVSSIESSFTPVRGEAGSDLDT